MLRTAPLVIGIAALVGGVGAWAITGTPLIAILGVLAFLAGLYVYARGLPVDGWSAPDQRRASRNGSGRQPPGQRPPGPW
jgi:hypothetical protein